jgi:hypothetical protein
MCLFWGACFLSVLLALTFVFVSFLYVYVVIYLGERGVSSTFFSVRGQTEGVVFFNFGIHEVKDV